MAIRTPDLKSMIKTQRKRKRGMAKTESIHLKDLSWKSYSVISVYILAYQLGQRPETVLYPALCHQNKICSVNEEEGKKGILGRQLAGLHS